MLSLVLGAGLTIVGVVALAWGVWNLWLEFSQEKKTKYSTHPDEFAMQVAMEGCLALFSGINKGYAYIATLIGIVLMLVGLLLMAL